MGDAGVLACAQEPCDGRVYKWTSAVMSVETGPEYDVVFVEDDDGETAVTVRADETVLDAARRGEVELRWSCTEGECTSCTGRLLDGAVDWLSDPKVVRDDQRDEGYFSLCLTRPAADSRIAVGDSVLVEAFPSVWRNLETNDE